MELLFIEAMKRILFLFTFISVSVIALHAQVLNLFERVNGTIVPNNAFIMLNNECYIPDNIQIYTYKNINVSYNNKQYKIEIKGTSKYNSDKFFDCFSILNSSGEDLLTYWGYDALSTVDFLTNNQSKNYFIQVPLNKESFALIFAGALYDYCDEAGEIIIVVISNNSATLVYNGRAFAYNYNPSPEFSIEFVDNIRYVSSVNELFDNMGNPTTTTSMLSQYNKYKIWRDGSMLKYQVWK